MSYKTKPKRPGLWAARAVPLAVTGLTAGFAVWGVAAPAWDDSPPLSLFLGAIFAGSAAMTPVMLFTAAKARSLAAVTLLGTCAVFGTIDAAGWSIAAARLERQLAAAEISGALADWQAAARPLAASLKAAQDAEAALPLASKVCGDEIGPQGCKARQDGVTADRKAAAERTAQAKADLAALGAAPAPRDLVKDDYLHLAGALIQIALAMAFWGVERTRERLYRDALAEWKADRDAARKPRAPKPAAAAPAPSAEDLAAAARRGPGPVLVISND